MYMYIYGCVRACVYMYICIHVYVYTYAYIYIHTYTFVNLFIYLFIYLYVCFNPLHLYTFLPAGHVLSSQRAEVDARPPVGNGEARAAPDATRDGSPVL